MALPAPVPVIDAKMGGSQEGVELMDLEVPAGGVVLDGKAVAAGGATIGCAAVHTGASEGRRMS